MLRVELACGHSVPLAVVENPEGDAWAFCGVCEAGEPVEAAECPECGCSLLIGDHDPHCPEGRLAGLTVNLVQNDDPAEPRTVLITRGPTFDIVAELSLDQAAHLAAALRVLAESTVEYREGDPF